MRPAYWKRARVIAIALILVFLTNLAIKVSTGEPIF
jgi:hypothetical protein